MSDSPAMRIRRPIASMRLPVRLTIALLIAASIVPIVSGIAVAASASYVANCSVNLRAGTSTSGSVLGVIPSGTIVTASGTVSGASWSASDCGGTSVSGTTWYAITAVNGSSASSAYGHATVYAATGLFSAATPPSSSFLEGVDVSGWQGTIDYDQVYASGRRFVIAKATEGIGFTDSMWTANLAGAPAAGLRLAGYHFARPDLNPTTSGAKGEADWYVSQLHEAPGMLIPALDLERHGTLSVAELTSWVKTWLGEVYALTGARPMIYVSPAFWRSYLGDSQWFAANGYKVLWVAHWTSASSPSVPAANWGGNGWTFWQYTSGGTVPGIDGSIDLDRYNGTDMTPVTFGATFSVAVGGGTAKQRQQASATVSIARTWFSLPVGVSVSGLPATVSSTVTPASTKGSSASLTLTTTASTPTGSYPFTITGTGNGLTKTAKATLVVSDGLPPTVVTPAVRLSTGRLGSTVPVKILWSASDPSGIQAYRAELQANGGSWSAVGLAAPTSKSVSLNLRLNTAWRLGARAQDGAGNWSGWSFGPTVKPVMTQENSTAITYSTGWTRSTTGTATVASGGALKYATLAGRWASFSFTGQAVGWVAYQGPNRGSANVYIDGVFRQTVNLYSKTYSARPIVFVANFSSSGTHTIKIVLKGTAGHPRVDLDGFVRLVPA